MPPYAKSSTDLKRFPIENLSQGILVDRNITQIPPGGAQSSLNFIWVDGYLRPRQGFGTRYSNGDANQNIGYIFSIPVFTRPNLPDTLCRVNYTASLGLSFQVQSSFSSTTSIWNTIASGFSQSAYGYHYPWCNFKNRLYVAGLAETHQFDGTFWVTLESQQTDIPLKCPSNANIVSSGDGRIFMADVVERGSGIRVAHRLCWSDLLRAQVWNGGDGGGSSGFIDLPRDSRAITGLVTATSGLMIFTAKDTYFGAFTGSPKVYDLRGVVNNVGCVSHETIRPYRDGAYIWLGDDNVYMGAPGQIPTPIGDKIRNRIKQKCRLDHMYKSFAVIDYDNNLYHLFTPDGPSATESGSVNTRMFTCNLKTSSWWEAEVGYAFYAASQFRESDWTSRMLTGGYQGLVCDMGFDYLNDLNLPIAGLWASGVISADKLFGQQAEQASFQWARVHAIRPDGTLDNVGFKFWGSQGLDQFRSVTPAVQTLDSTDARKLATSERLDAENFYVEVSFATAQQCPHIARIDTGFIPLGVTR